MAHPGTFAAPYRSNLRKPGFTPLSRASSLWNITLAIGLASKPGQDQFPSILVRLGVNPHPPVQGVGPHTPGELLLFGTSRCGSGLASGDSRVACRAGAGRRGSLGLHRKRLPGLLLYGTSQNGKVLTRLPDALLTLSAKRCFRNRH
jgi:hypothetical protein